MSDRRVKAYVGIMCVAATLAAALTDWETLFSLPKSSMPGFIGLVGIGLLAEGLAIRLDVGRAAGTSSIVFLPLLAGVQLFGPGAGVVLIVTTQLFGEFVVRQKGPLKGTFNVAQAVFATAVAGWAFSVLGGVPLKGGLGDIPATGIAGQIWPFVSFGLVVLALNHAAVSLAITLSQGLPFRQVWDLILSHSGASLNDILVAPIALAVAFLYVQFGFAGILVILLPMLFIRYSYLTTSRLREANRDLLKALVKAIETRDPYTSGHSLRVSLLARKIAEHLGLGARIVGQIEMAALLHDIGKIEVGFAEILSKPEALTSAEREIIQSHSIKGEEFIRNLSSVPEEIALAVRHHHEREDGSGYPDGLRGGQIPIGAKIIAVCDAVDAMLSDRPYRLALPVTAVLQQLRIHAGTQFDHKVATALIGSSILSEYTEIMRVGRSEPGLAADASYETFPSLRAHPARPTRRIGAT